MSTYDTCVDEIRVIESIKKTLVFSTNQFRIIRNVLR